MKKVKCVFHQSCIHADEGCWTSEPKNCVRFMPTTSNNYTEINGIVETPPNIDADMFSQYFINWIDAMGWCFGGGIKPAPDDKDANDMD